MTSSAAHIDHTRQKKKKKRSTRHLKRLAQRQQLIDTVRAAWIDGVLEPLRSEEQWLALTAESVSDTMPAESVVLDSGEVIADVFEQAGRRLLILGAPGSGKTTILLALAEELLRQAQLDSTLPVPVVFQLASWAELQPENFDEWLVEQLKTQYGVSRTLAGRWIEDGELLLLLDGLDDIPPADRNTCIGAINAFWDAGHAMRNNGIVMSRRLEVFDDLTERLPVAGEIFLQPLTSEQTADYLLALGDDGTDLYDALLADPVLSELAQSPLMLSLIAAAYRGEPYGQITGFASAADQRQHLFDQYIARCMSEAAAHPAYDYQQTRFYLTWLAAKMMQHRQSVFHIDRLQPPLVGYRSPAKTLPACCSWT